MKSNRLIFGSIASLVFGTLIYILFRASTLKVFTWLNFIGIDFLGSGIRKTALQVSGYFPDWFLLSFPDGLWLFSYVCLMLFVWKSNVTIQNLFWMTIVPMIAVGSEILQGFGLMIGTFDIVDLFFYCLGGILPFLIFRKSINYNFKFFHYEQKC